MQGQMHSISEQEPCDNGHFSQNKSARKKKVVKNVFGKLRSSMVRIVSATESQAEAPSNTINGLYTKRSALAVQGIIEENGNGMATALSLDHWEAPKSSKCNFESNPDLAVDFVCMHPADYIDKTENEQPPDKASAARFQEIFCDYIGLINASNDASSRHVLDERFDSFLDERERSFKTALLGLLDHGMPAAAKQSHAYETLQHLLENKMGYGRPSESDRFDKIQRMKQRREGTNSRLFAKAKNRMRKVLFHEGSSSAEISNASSAKIEELIASIRSDGTLCRRLALKQSSCVPEIVETLKSEKHFSNEDINLILDSLHSESGHIDDLLRTPGHVFVCNGSVCDLSCDAFLCPVAIGREDENSLRGVIYNKWKNTISKVDPRLAQHLNCRAASGNSSYHLLKHYEEYDHVVTFHDWPWKDFQEKSMVQVPFFIAGESDFNINGKLPAIELHLAMLLDTVTEFIAVALQELRKHQPEPYARRERYLLALPVIGTGGGSAGDITGLVVESVLRKLSEIVSTEQGVDCILVCADEATYSHAQHVRMLMVKEDDTNVVTNGLRDHFPCFRLQCPFMRQKAEKLANLASTGQLSLFLGAGVSMGSGLPCWFSLLEGVEDQFTEHGTAEERKLGNDRKWDPLLMAKELDDIASTQADRDGVKKSFKERVCSIIDERSRHPSLLLTLLASLECKSIVTQNYDHLIERAYENRNLGEKSHFLKTNKLSVIPHRPLRGARVWLLKMHGCVSHPKSIVITEEDYDHYEEGRQKALSGLVQANLMTSHFLFVGFSLSDPNYLRIVEEVRLSLDPDCPAAEYDDQSEQHRRMSQKRARASMMAHNLAHSPRFLSLASLSTNSMRSFYSETKSDDNNSSNGSSCS